MRGFEESASVFTASIIDAEPDQLALVAPAAAPTISNALRLAAATAALVALTLIGAAAAAWVFQINWRIVVQQKEFPAQPPQPGVRVPTPIRSIPPPDAGTQR